MFIKDDCGELSISVRQGEWTCASLPDRAGRGCQETSLKKPYLGFWPFVPRQPRFSTSSYLEVLFHKASSNRRADTNHSQILWCQEPSGEQKAFANTLVDALTMTGERELLRSGIQMVGRSHQHGGSKSAALIMIFGTHHR